MVIIWLAIVCLVVTIILLMMGLSRSFTGIIYHSRFHDFIQKIPIISFFSSLSLSICSHLRIQIHLYPLIPITGIFHDKNFCNWNSVGAFFLLSLFFSLVVPIKQTFSKTFEYFPRTKIYMVHWTMAQYFSTKYTNRFYSVCTMNFIYISDEIFFFLFFCTLNWRARLMR